MLQFSQPASLRCIALLILALFHGGPLNEPLVAQTFTSRTITPEDERESDETALFRISVDGKKGFIDATGDIVIKPQYQAAYPFQEGLAAVQIDGVWGFVRRDGQLAIAPQFKSVGLFSDGRAKVRASFDSDPWQYIDRTGTITISEGFDCAGPFRNGVARVGKQSLLAKFAALADIPVTCEFFYIDQSGQHIPEPAPEHFARGIEDELIPFQQDELFGYVDAQGEVIIAPQFRAAGAFLEGLAWARKNEQSGYIDSSGAFVIQAHFDVANDFSKGLAAVSLNGKWGLINREGKFVIEPQYSWIYGAFQDGLLEVVQDGKSGYINADNEWVWKPSV